MEAAPYIWAFQEQLTDVTDVSHVMRAKYGYFPDTGFRQLTNLRLERL